MLKTATSNRRVTLSTWQLIKRQKMFYLFLLPAVLFVSIFNYIPMAGISIALMFVLGLGSLVSGNFDSVYNLMNPLVATKAEVIDTYVYRTGIQLAKYSYATSIGLVQSIFSVTLVFIGFKWAKKINGYSILE